MSDSILAMQALGSIAQPVAVIVLAVLFRGPIGMAILRRQVAIRLPGIAISLEDRPPPEGGRLP